MASATVLCIDDRIPMLLVRKSSLEAHGFSVEVATNVQKGLKLLEQVPVAAVLLEYKLEGMDAEAVAFHIRQRFPTLPIILLSAYSEMPERILWLVNEYVMRSAPLEHLVTVLERVLLSSTNCDARRVAA